MSFDCGSGQIGSSEPDRVLQLMADTSSNTSAAADTGAYAIVEASGQQFWLQPNRYYDLDRLNAELGSHPLIVPGLGQKVVQGPRRLVPKNLSSSKN